MPPQMTGEGGGEEGFGGGEEGGGIGMLCTEGHLVAEAAQNGHGSGGKALGGGEGILHRKLQHQIRPRLKRSPCPEHLVEDGRVAPLDEIAAHQADDGCLFRRCSTYHGHLFCVTQMQGVIFT